jgi:hypothetical protein
MSKIRLFTIRVKSRCGMCKSLHTKHIFHGNRRVQIAPYEQLIAGYNDEQYLSERHDLENIIDQQWTNAAVKQVVTFLERKGWEPTVEEIPLPWEHSKIPPYLPDGWNPGGSEDFIIHHHDLSGEYGYNLPFAVIAVWLIPKEENLESPLSL